MKKFSLFLGRYWQVAAVAIGVLALATVLYTYGTTTFLPGVSSAESQAITQTTSLSLIATNPLWLPHKLLMFIFHFITSSDTALRYASALVIALVVFSFYSIAKRFYSTRVSVLTTLLFAVSTPVLTTARVATPAALLFGWVLIMSLALWFRHSHKKRFAPFVFFMLGALLLYIPASIWFIGFLAAWFWRDIPKLFKHLNKKWLAGGITLGLIVLSPLIYSFVKDPTLIRSWLLLPTSFDPETSFEAAKQLPAVFFYKTAIPAGYNLANLPLLDAFSGTMLLLGVYAYRKKLSLSRTIVYLVAIVCSSLLAIVNSNQLYIYYFLPFAYLLIAEGIGYLLSEWRSVFPKNPIARFVGTIIMSIAVIAVCGYHLNRYFLAWVQAPETKAIYSKKSQQ